MRNFFYKISQRALRQTLRTPRETQFVKGSRRERREDAENTKEIYEK